MCEKVNRLEEGYDKKDICSLSWQDLIKKKNDSSMNCEC
jgi:hypothetical protein